MLIGLPQADCDARPSASHSPLTSWGIRMTSTKLYVCVPSRADHFPAALRSVLNWITVELTRAPGHGGGLEPRRG